MPSMTLDERIKRETEKLEQLKQQKRSLEAREKEKERATDTRRKIIAGAILLDVFPQFQILEPKRKKAENLKEFSPLANFLKNIADNKELTAQLEKNTEQKTNAPAPPKIEQGENDSQS